MIDAVIFSPGNDMTSIPGFELGSGKAAWRKGVNLKMQACRVRLIWDCVEWMAGSAILMLFMHKIIEYMF